MVKLNDLVSPAYRQTLQETHTEQKRWGNGGKYHWQSVATFARTLQASTILDYGCGQGLLKKNLLVEYPHLTVSEYDPGLPGRDTVPTGVYDIVACTDVLEHVEPDRVDLTLEHMRSLTAKGLFAIISLRPAALVLTDGRNAHLTVQPAEWWEQRIRAAGFFILAANENPDVKGLLVRASIVS